MFVLLKQFKISIYILRRVSNTSVVCCLKTGITSTYKTYESLEIDKEPISFRKPAQNNGFLVLS